MSQYQSFPNAAGASRTLDKLKALKLPVLEGRSFLDIGCNEGFFCGFAKFLGASRVVGLDKSKLFIERARIRFPDCEFLQQDWDSLPDGTFDVILLASALHYAEDQPALLRRLVDKLSPDGTLVLEMGIASSAGSEWVEVERGIDTRFFPTMKKLREVLDDYAWKWMGRSVAQAGDPVSRHVVHVSQRRPTAYLLMQPPGYGKSSIASRLFGIAGISLVSGDESIAAIAQGSIEVPEALRAAVTEDYSPFRIDIIVRRIFERGAGADLIDVWARASDGGDFALDMFVPVEHQSQVVEHLAGLGYLPVCLQWERVGPPLMPAVALAERAEAFYEALSASGAFPIGDDLAVAGAMRGFVDELQVEPGKVLVRGWVVDDDGKMPDALTVRINGQEYLVDEFETLLRPDVQRHLHLSHSRAGYRLNLDVPGVERVADIRDDFAVLTPGGGYIRLTGRVRSQLRGDSSR